MPSKGKTKGNSWEREVASFLTDLYGEPFVRVPNSGAFIGGKNHHRKSNLSEEQIRGFKGDIIPGPSFPKLNIEGKFYADFPFHQVVAGSCKQLDQWLDQLMVSADADDFNLLAMKFNRKGAFIALEMKNVPPVQIGLNHMRYHSEKHGAWIIQEFESFWRVNKDTAKILSSHEHEKNNSKGI